MTFDSKVHLGHLIVPNWEKCPTQERKEKRARKINTAQLNTKHGSVELRGICYLLNSLLHLLLPPNPITPQSLMHEPPGSLLSSLQVIWPLWFGQDWNDCERRAREVRSVLTYWSKPPSALQQKTSCFGFGEETMSAWNIFYTQLRSACRALRLIQIFSDQISKYWHKHLQYFRKTEVCLIYI